MDLFREYGLFSEMDLNSCRFALVQIHGIATRTFVLTTREADYQRLFTQSTGFAPNHPAGVDSVTFLALF